MSKIQNTDIKTIKLKTIKYWYIIIIYYCLILKKIHEQKKSHVVKPK